MSSDVSNEFFPSSELNAVREQLVATIEQASPEQLYAFAIAASAAIQIANIRNIMPGMLSPEANPQNDTATVSSFILLEQDPLRPDFEGRTYHIIKARLSGLSDRDIASATGATDRTVARWRIDGVPEQRDSRYNAPIDNLGAVIDYLLNDLHLMSSEIKKVLIQSYYVNPENGKTTNKKLVEFAGDTTMTHAILSHANILFPQHYAAYLKNRES